MMKYGKKDEYDVSDLGGHGPVMGIKGLVLQGIMRAMDEKESKKLKGRGRPSSYAKGSMTDYEPGGAAPSFERHGR